MRPIHALCLLLFFSISSFAQQSNQYIKDLSKNNWKIWLDKKAGWVNDQLYSPPVDIKNLPLNLPSGGWEALEAEQGISVNIPATVEQYYWGENGNSFGVSGNYVGVSWFTTNTIIPDSLKGKRVFLKFESVRFRAEIFINRVLVGYDLVNGTPFEVDISNAAIYGKINEIAVRITDPNGNFDWRDSQNFIWGNYRTNPTHGFGGITGEVFLTATDKIFIEDVFVKNKPKPNEIDVQITINNFSENISKGSLLFEIYDYKEKRIKAFEKEIALTELKNGSNTYTYTFLIENAKLWSVDEPNLFILKTRWVGEDKSKDEHQQRFGFRWFEVKDVNGDKQFYLNNKRIVLRTSISWGFWPVNGIAPSDEFAKKQIETAKKIGLNMLNFHRTIGQQNVLDYADELGLLYYEEPGGNQYPADLFVPEDSLGKIRASFYISTRNEKLFRMIKRDRNHPSLVIYNMHNERVAEPLKQDEEQMMAAHKLDETRIITYNSSNGEIKTGPDRRFKLHMLPYDFTIRDYGWFDQHHAGGSGTYHNNLYNNPNDYLRYTDHKDEIIFWGEEGAIGTPPRLQLIHDEILKTGRHIGWESDAYLKWYNVYDSFLKNTPGFSKAFPNVDSLTRKMGNVAYYYQGRIIENIRINNITDGYAVNGWESMKIENHSGIVDNYRNPKGDPELISKYTKPVFIAIKMNKNVLRLGDTSIVDFHIVNELNLKGVYNLEIKVKDESGKIIKTKNGKVTVSGGNVYGELISPGFLVIPQTQGYTTISAELKKNNETLAKGNDKLFAVKLNPSNICEDGMIADTSGIMKTFFQSIGLNSLREFKSGRPNGKFLLVGAFEPQQTGNPLVTDILEWVNEGNTLIVAGTIEKWTAFLAKKEILDYRGVKELGKTWYGGNYFVKEHPFFHGLPQNCVFNWEYQSLATYNKSRLGLRIFNGETIVACVSDHKQEVYSALSVVAHGRGKIIICALDIFSTIKNTKTEKREEGEGENAAMNTFNISQKNAANVVGQQLLLNLIKTY